MDNILIVDDNLQNLQVLTALLERAYVVRAVPSGAMALRAIQAQPPDLVLLDIRMPGLDGYEVCRRLKSDPATCAIPIIFISALDATDDKVRAFDAGGVDYISKPFQEREVMARIKTHLSLRKLRQQLEQQIEELDAFAHTVAHDLKNPAGIMMSLAVVLNRDWDALGDSERTEMLTAIARTARKLNDIIEALLLLAGVRKAQVVCSSLDMVAIVRSALEQLSGMIADYRAEVIVPDAMPAALGYAPWVEEIWVNYISNAIKYGGNLSALPRVELGATSQADGWVRFWVRDNGRGLTPDEQARLFTPFTRLHRLQEGHGLGLSIVERIADKLGGQVGVESEVGHGSTFYFTLPAGCHRQE